MSDKSEAAPAATPSEQISRPLYVRHVPEATWNKVHQNALKSRMRLSEYLVRLMEQSEPFPPQPLVKRSRPKLPPSQTPPLSGDHTA